MSKSRVLSCIQPTGKGQLHIGNYFGAIRNWVQMQNTYECFYGIVDYHAITVDHDPEQLPAYCLDMMADLMACGLDPEKCVLFVQSHVPEHLELTWILDCVASYGDLTRMTQFKDKQERQAYATVGLFNYPVLQAADILTYKATLVPVGQDQDQHLELTRDIAAKFNNRFGELFPIPLTGPEVRRMVTEKGAKIPSLADPTKKMSKSYGEKHYVGLMEPEDAIRQKVRGAVTDVGPDEHPGAGMSPGVETLFTLLELTAPKDVLADFEERYRDKSIRYGDLKEAVYEHLMAELAPIRVRKRQLNADPDVVRAAISTGREKARAVAAATLEEARARVGVGFGRIPLGSG